MASLLAFHDKHGIVTASFAGLSPLFRSRSTTLDTVLSGVAQRLSETAGKPVSEDAVLMAWQRAKGVVFVTYVFKLCHSQLYTNSGLLVLRQKTVES